MRELRFDGRVAVVTGAGRGLGRAYAELLGARGAKVVVNDYGGSVHGQGSDPGPAEDVARAIRLAGGEAVACPESVATPEGGRAIVQAALDRYGRIDILVHNAGFTRPASLKEMSYEDFDAVLDVHLRGGFHVVRPAFPVMCQAGYGRIVLTTSTGGLYGSRRQANYGAAKTGLMGLSNIVALEGAAEGVKCNLLAPGAVTRISEGLDTSGFPPTMRPDVVAPVVAWLAHESCPITGEMVISMAGRVARFVLAETKGVFCDPWTPEKVAEEADAIRSTDELLIFPIVPEGHSDHVRYSFEMAGGSAQGWRR
jgi:NAD(P)-dependent dehydrogenase (short-subunit alcohol dehydrogenase family)